MLIRGSGMCLHVVSARIHGLNEAMQPRAAFEPGATLALTEIAITAGRKIERIHEPQPATRRIFAVFRLFGCT